jgi:hypothetical protein
MHVVRQRANKQLLFIDHRRTSGPLPGREVYASFDPSTMELGWTDDGRIPAYFDIDPGGKVVELHPDEAAQRGLAPLPPTRKLVEGKVAPKSEAELIAEGLLDLAAIKGQAIEAYSGAAFALRAQLIPEYKLQNAALGIYEEDEVAGYKATIEAFRKEFYRLKKEVEAARSMAALAAIKPDFPTQLLPAPKRRKRHESP